MIKLKWMARLVVCVWILAIGVATQAQDVPNVTLTAWTHDQLYIDYFESRLPEFQALHPEVNITFEPTIDSAAPTNAVNAIAAGESLPDLLGIERGSFPNFMRNGIIASYFLDLTDRIGDRRDEYAEGRWTIYSYEGRIYAIESSLTASVLYYQPAVFEAAGAEVPTTWEQVLNDVGPKLVANGSAFTFATNDGTWFQMYFNQRGGQIFNENGEFVLGDETNRPIAIEVAGFLQQAVQQGIMMVVLGGDVWSGATIPTAYQEGRLAGTVMPDWWASCCLQPGVPDMEGQWAVAAPPRWEDGGFGTLTWGGTGWAVNSNSPHAELAWEFLEFMYLGKESQIARFQAINMFPTMFEAANDPAVTELENPFFGGQRLGEIYAQLAPEVPVWYQSPFGSVANTALGDNLPGLFDGSLTPEAFVDNVVRATQDAIDFGF
jgi:ABC-type glycerol-3-phosphate transport system substrate-binding protein